MWTHGGKCTGDDTFSRCWPSLPKRCAAYPQPTADESTRERRTRTGEDKRTRGHTDPNEQTRPRLVLGIRSRVKLTTEVVQHEVLRGSKR